MVYYSGMQPTNRKRTTLFVRAATPRPHGTLRLSIYSVSGGIVAQGEKKVKRKMKKGCRRTTAFLG